MDLGARYPEKLAERDSWILDRRMQRNLLDPSRPYGFFVEEECSSTGEVVPVATILLTNRECPWRCAMCDLWKNTLTETVPEGAIVAQIDYALSRLPKARQIKLYNSGSFFDSRAIPVKDYAAIASRVSEFDRVIVESHPALIGASCLRFNDLLDGTLEVAMGLETAHAQVLEKLNKRMTLEQYSYAAQTLDRHHIHLRAFLLAQPPFMKEEDALEWAMKSLDFAFECGATAATLIPTRGGNGAMESLALAGEFSLPSLETLEAAAAYGLSLNRGRVFSDLWETRQIKTCDDCRDERLQRLRWMNLHQRIAGPVSCVDCGGTVAA